MPTIQLQTYINAPIDRVFDLSRSIDMHSISSASTNEKAIAGRTSGLIEAGETVTWEATHFGIRQQLQSKITAMEYPHYFRDEMLKGAFKSIYHEHFFEEQDGGTLVKDVFRFEAPFGILGVIFNRLVLTNYMSRFIAARNAIVKQYAETDAWRTILK